ncbi:MAG TPA: hypothetical protein VGM88_05430 [Kofleriaceae bacterium]|jgi:colicin import membrane protein
MASLGELRAIEQQRIVDERTAVARAAEETARAREAAAQAIADAEARQIADARAAEIAKEQAKAAAEREARLRVEAASAAEQAREQAKLDAMRAAEEISIKRETARRKRPRWMIAVTAGALAMTAGLGWYAHARALEADDANRTTAIAQETATTARTDADTSAKKLGEMQGTLGDLEAQTTAAIAKVDAARDAAARDAAARDAREVRRKQEAQDAAIAQAKIDADHKARLHPVVISEECKKNALAKGCL